MAQHNREISLGNSDLVCLSSLTDPIGNLIDITGDWVPQIKGDQGTSGLQGAANPLDVDSVPDRTDPATYDPEYRITVRAIGQTEQILQRLVIARRMTFWGEAIALIFDFIASNPGTANLDIAGLDMPQLTHHGGAIRYRGAGASKNILAPLSVNADRFLKSMARRLRMSREKAAALILYQNAAPITALIMNYTAPLTDGDL